MSNSEYISILMQGSGTFGNEACIHTMTPRNRQSRYLILENGAYGVRLDKICKLLGIQSDMLSFPEDRAINLKQVDHYFSVNRHVTYTHICVIHNETTGGVLNNVEAIGQIARKYNPSKFDFKKEFH